MKVVLRVLSVVELQTSVWQYCSVLNVLSSSILLSHTGRKITSPTPYVVIFQCEKMTDEDFFPPSSSTCSDRISWKKEIPTLDIHTQLYCANGSSCMHSNNVRQWVKHFKDGNTYIANQLCGGDLRCASTERNKGKIGDHQRESVCDSEENVSRYWSRAQYCVGGTGKFGILRSLCLVGFSLVDGGAQA